MIETVDLNIHAIYEALKVTVKHPVVKLPDEAQVHALLAQDGGRERLIELLSKREKLIALMQSDPLRYGWEPEIWAEARALLNRFIEVLIMGGNRSTKTEFAAREICYDICSKPNKIAAFFHSSDDASRRLQHPRVYKYLPAEWRDLPKGKMVNISFTEKNGFTDNVFILPNGSRGFFFNYKQDVKVLEGYELDWAWCDELVPPEFLMALRYRLITRRGKLLITFTPVEGYTPVVGDYLGASKLVKSLRSPLLPGQNVRGVPAGEMPYVMECATRKAAVIFFFTEFNKFNPYDELCAQLEKESTRNIKIRAYGWPDRAKGNVFPKFGSHNIIPEEKIPQEGTNYHYADFAWARNWAMVWFRVTEHKGKKRIYIYREWPDYDTYGEWVVPSVKADGERGPAQSSLGLGIKQYKRLVLGKEVISNQEGVVISEKIFGRRCDPRSGRATAVSEDGGTCLIDMLRDEHMDEQGVIPSLDFEPASGDNLTEGVNLINEWLEYDDSRPVDVTNEPILYVNEKCRNVIDCLRMWTGQDGLKGASKDFVDVLRYAAQDRIEYVAEGALGSQGGWSY